MLADEGALTPKALATPLLFASLRAAQAAEQVEQDARLVLQTLGGSGRGRCLRGVVDDIKARLGSRHSPAASPGPDPGASGLLGWIARLEAAMDRRTILDSLPLSTTVGSPTTDPTWPQAPLPEVLQTGVADWLQCADDFAALHQDALKPGFGPLAGGPRATA